MTMERIRLGVAAIWLFAALYIARQFLGEFGSYPTVRPVGGL